nr:baseplate J/gp47 family protein [uncultured Fusobacterium sp.]
MRNKIELRNKFLDKLENALSKMEGTFNFDIASANGTLLEELYLYLEYMEKQTFIDTATEDWAVDYHALLFGVKRRLGTKSKGEIKVKGKPNTTILTGTVLLNRKGVKYKTLGDILLNSNGIGTGEIECFDSGEIGNCAIGEITTFEISNADVYSVLNEREITGGFEKEPNSSLIARAKEKITKPAHSGNIYDYIQWAKQVEGVGRVTVKPLWNGNGTVKVLVANYNDEVADSALIQKVRERIEREDGKPVGANVTIVGFNNKNIAIAATVILKQGYKLIDLQDKIIVAIRQIIKNGGALFNKNLQEVLSINRIEKTVLELDGILECFVKVNNSTQNINVSEEEILNITGVTVNEQ